MDLFGVEIINRPPSFRILYDSRIESSTIHEGIDLPFQYAG